MRLILMIAAVAVAFLVPPAFAANPWASPQESEESAQALRDVTGLEWLQQSISERSAQVMYSLFTIKKNGVLPARTTNDYYNALNTALRADPSLYESQLTQILADYIYRSEPENRAALDQLKKTAPTAS